MRVVRHGLVAVVIAGVVLAAAVNVPWSGSINGPTTPALHPTDTSLPATAPAPEARCPGPGAPPVGRSPANQPTLTVHQAVLTTADGVHLAAVRAGGGGRGVVLVHDDGGDLCTWWRFARQLAGQGFHVLAFDLRCYGYSECGRRRDYVADTTAAVAALRQAGASRVALVGTALGASVALITAAREDAGVSAVVAVSLVLPDAEVSSDPDGPHTVTGALSGLAVPLLFCVADADAGTVPVTDLAALVGTAPNRQIHTTPGPVHGTDLLADNAGPVTDFLGTHLTVPVEWKQKFSRIQVVQ